MKKILIIILAMGMILSFSACSTDPEAEKGPLTIGVMGSIDALPIAIAKDMGYFAKNEVDVDLQVFKSAKDRDAALEAGLLDGVICDEIAIAIYNNAGLEMKIISSTDGSFSLIAGKDTGIEEIKDFTGKRVAISENTVIEFTLDKLLSKDGLEDEVQKVIVPPMPSRMEMLNQGQVEGALLPQPFSDIAISQGGKEIAKVDSKGQYISVIAFKEEAIKEKTIEIKNFLDAYDEGVSYINLSNISDYEELLVSFVGYPAELLGSISLPTFRMNTLPPIEDIEEVFQWARDKELLTVELEANEVIYSFE